MEILNLSLKELVESVKKKKVSACEVAETYLKRASSLNSQLNAYISFNEQVIDEARKLDSVIANSNEDMLKRKPLLGVPFGIKDLLCTRGLKTTAASKILENFISPYDATVVCKLKESGALILGKTNLDEFAMGSSNETSFFGACKNPWNTEYVPGGSSGGSAVAQAARMAAACIGTDTGGSIRQPSSFCNVVGVKPTYGRVSRYGIIAYASSLDQAGPMTNSVEDAALVLESICGLDDRDMTTSDRPVESFSEDLIGDLKGKKIGILKEFLNDSLNSEVLEKFNVCVESLKKLGAEIVEISVPLANQSIPIYYLVASAEASSNLSRYDGVKYGYRSDFKDLSSLDLQEFYSRTRSEGFGNEVKRRIMLGTYCLSSGYYDAYYNKACQVRRILRDQFTQAFSKCDIIVSPVCSQPPFKMGEKINDPLSMYLNDLFTVSTNLAGLPALSIPYGFSKNKLPIGMQLIANHFEEKKLIQVAYRLEQTSPSKGHICNV